MAPRARRGEARRGEASQPQAFHELGVRGRKTGVFLPDGGERDEHGMQPLEAIFSSPQEAAASTNGGANDDSGSEDMDIASSPGPGPRTLLKSQREVKYPIPRSRSPLKTNLNSPARKHPHVERFPSPTRASVDAEDRDATVTRRLDFNARTAKSRLGGAAANGKLNGANGPRSVIEEEDSVPTDHAHVDAGDIVEESLQMIDAISGGDDDDDDEPEPPQAASPEVQGEEEQPARRGRGRPRREDRQKVEESLQMIHAISGGDDDDDDEPEPEPEPEPPQAASPEVQEEEEQPARRGRGRPRREDRQKQASQKSQPASQKSQPASQKSQPASQKSPPASQKSPPAKKRRSLRNSTGGDGADKEPEADDDDEPRQTKRQRTQGPAVSKPSSTAKTAAEPRAMTVRAPSEAKTSSSAKAPAAKTTTEARSKAAEADSKPRPKGRQGRKAKETGKETGADEEAGEASFMALQRGPPLPKARGLVSVRRDADGVTQTRSGRHSYRPVEYWRGEQVIREDEEQNDMFHNSNFVLPSIKEVVRVAPDAPPSKRAPGSKSRAKAGSNSKQAVVEDEELEEWEVHPGTVTGEVVVWKPEHEEHPPGENDDVDIEDDRVAISADAIQTSDIKDATFRFAKTLSLPFMGAGVVDLPPGAEKRPKNSRKMHMVFFVHYGKVLVTINETQFRISAGGMWFVPRGNYYSITNDFDNHARIFFSQGNEVRPSPADASPAPSTTPLGY